MVQQDLCIVPISIWDKLRLIFQTSIFGTWIVCKMLLKWIWNPISFSTIQPRDNPPMCLVDSSLGQHKYVKLKGVKLHYVESGSKENPMVLLLHGFPDFWLGWRYQIPLLREHFRVIALDLKGFGDSDKPSRRSLYKAEVLLQELKQLVTSSLGVSNCTIIGHDVGGLLAWCFAHKYPEVVNKVVIVSCAHPNIFRSSTELHLNRWQSFVQLPILPELDALKEDVHIINDYHKHLTGGSNSSNSFLEAYKYAFCRKEDWSGPLNYFRNLIWVEISKNSNQIQVPVVLITGNRDKQTKLEAIVKSSDFCDKFYVKLIDGAGHFPHQECPVKFNDILTKYVVMKKTIGGQNGPGVGGSNKLVNTMLGAVSSTVKYGNSVLDTVQKRTSNVVGTIPTINLLNYSNVYGKTNGL